MGSRKLSHDVSSTEADSVAAASAADASMSYKSHHMDPRDAVGRFQGLQNDVMASSSTAESNVAHLSVFPLRLVTHVGCQLCHAALCCAVLCWWHILQLQQLQHVSRFAKLSGAERRVL